MLSECFLPGVQQSVRKLPFIKDPKLSKIQYAMSSTKSECNTGYTIFITCWLVLPWHTVTLSQCGTQLLINSH